MPKKGNSELICFDSDTKERYKKLIESLTYLFQAKTKDEVLDITIQEIQNFINAEGTSVWLSDRNHASKLILARTYTSDGRLTVGESSYRAGKINSGEFKGKYEGLTGYIFSTGKPLIIKNITDQEEIKTISKSLKWSDKYKGWEGKKETKRPFLGVPILSIEERKKVIGVLRIATTKDREPFNDIDQKLAEVFSTSLSFKLSEFEREDLELDLFTSLYTPIVEKETFPSPDDLMNNAIQKFTSLFPGSHGSILMDDGNGRFFFKVSSNKFVMKRIISGELDSQYYTSGQGKTGSIIKDKVAKLFVGNIAKPLSSDKPKESCESDEDATSFIGAPIVDVSSNKVIGVIRSAKHSRHLENDFDEQNKILLNIFARQLSFLITFCNNFEKKDTLGIMHGFIDAKDVDGVIEKFSTPKTPSEDITIMFVDIIGFTNFCNLTLDSDPKQIIEFLNTFFETMGNIVKKYDGIINSIKGDEFLSLFNAFKPCKNHRFKAISCAFEVVNEFFASFRDKVVQKMDEEFGIKYPDDFLKDIGLKVGLHTTQNVVMGAMGPKNSQTITITGQDVNLASRLITEVADEYPGENKLILSFVSTFNHHSVNGKFKAGYKYHHIRGTGNKKRKDKIFQITDIL